MGTLMDKILKKISYEGDCWIWTGCINTDGYPKLNRKVNGVWNANIKGHRYVYEQVNGVIPEGHVVRHICDNTLCLNPAHLLVGTATDNMRDRVNRGRSSNNFPREHLELVKELRLKGLSQQEVANILKCSQAHISKIETGKYVLING